MKIGDKVKALRTVYYCCGQCADDKIRRGEIVTVESIDERGRLQFREHANRYGPYYSDDFKGVSK